jgi:hypothetical protein
LIRHRYKVVFIGPGVINTDISARAGLTVWAFTATGADKKARRRIESYTRRSWSEHGAVVTRLP